MQQVLDFLATYFQAEYEALVARHIEPDYGTFQSKRDRVLALHAAEQREFIRKAYWSRATTLSEMDINFGKRVLESQKIAPRTLFQVKRYEHPELGELYRAYVSQTSSSRSGRYWHNFFITRTADGWQIVAIYRRRDGDLEFGADREKLLYDGYSYWEHEAGLKIELLEEPVEVTRVQAPTDIRDLAEYEEFPAFAFYVTDFMAGFCEREYEALVAAYTERDQATYEAIVARAERFLSEGVRLDLPRPAEPDEAWFEQGQQRIQELAPREIFMYDSYNEHPTYDPFFRFYMSAPEQASRSQRFAATFFVGYPRGQQDRVGARIVSRYDLVETASEERPVLEEGLLWQWHSGLVMTGERGFWSSTTRFRAPEDPTHRRIIHSPERKQPRRPQQ